MAATQSYTNKDIKVLKGLEAVRKRPGMYIGSTGPRGLHHLVYEVVDNSVDEALAGFCKKIQVTIDKDDSITVIDDGRGIPVDRHATERKPTVEVVCTVLHAGGKFDNEAYKVSGGLHGVGISVVNALSDEMTVEVKRDGKIHSISFSKGVTSVPLHEIGTYKGNKTGTKVTYHPDPEIFETTTHDFDTLADRFREIAFLNKDLRITFTDLRPEEPVVEEYCYSGGVVDYVKYINDGKDVLFSKPIYFEVETKGVGSVEIAMQWNSSYTENIHPFANNIRTTEGGTHLEGFKNAITRSVNDYARAHGILKEKDDNLTGSMLGRFGSAKTTMPGGCNFGVRPIDQHIKGMTALGASIDVKNGFIYADAAGGRLHGARIYLDKVSVGATMNIMIAAVLASGRTIIENAAREQIGRAHV